MITPTVGRQVWFWPNNAMPQIPNFPGEPCAATVCKVWSDKMVNLQVIDANGYAHSVTSVQLLQDADPAPLYSPYCEWMPYQKAQAAPPSVLA